MKWWLPIGLSHQHTNLIYSFLCGKQNKTDFSKCLANDIKIREYFEKSQKANGISKVQIERNSKRCEIIVHTAKPGVIIGRGGEQIEAMKKELSKLINEESRRILQEHQSNELDKFVSDAREAYNKAIESVSIPVKENI